MTVFVDRSDVAGKGGKGGGGEGGGGDAFKVGFSLPLRPRYGNP